MNAAVSEAMAPEDRVKFWSHVTRSGPSECWPWDNRTGGYGRFWWGGRLHSATRISLRLSGVLISDSDLVCHHCDNPSCVNPGHLFVGTQSDNILDAVRKGRHVPPIGERNGQARLSNQDVSEIRRLRAEGVPGRAVAQKFSVSQATVSMIHRAKRWRGVQS